MPPIFSVAPFATLKVPPATVVPRLAVNEARSSVPAATTTLPALAVVEFNAGRLPASVLISPPLIRKVP